MNTIYNVNTKPYVLDPFDRTYNKGYMFPKDVGKTTNNKINFTANNKAALIQNKEIKQKVDKYKNLINQMQSQNTKTQLNTLI